MNTKSEMIEHIKKMLDEKGLDFLMLDQCIRTKWPSDDRQYVIREIEFNREQNRLNAYQRWDQEQTFFCVDQFDNYDVSLIEKEVVRSLDMLKEYRVRLITYADIIATNPNSVKKIVKYHPHEVKKKSLWIELDGEPEELESWLSKRNYKL